MFERLYGYLRKRKKVTEHQTLHAASVNNDIPYQHMWRLCREILTSINPDTILKTEAHIKHIHRVRVPYFTLEAYLVELQSIQQALMRQERLIPHWTGIVEAITLSEFMRTEDDRYMSFNDLIVMFKLGGEICQLMEQAEGEDTGVVGSNNRVLIPFFVRFRDTLIDLYDLQLR